MRKKIFGDEDANVVSSYNNVGVVYLDLGQYNEAKEYHEKALIIKKHDYRRQRNESNETKDCVLF